MKCIISFEEEECTKAGVIRIYSNAKAEVLFRRTQQVIRRLQSLGFYTPRHLKNTVCSSCKTYSSRIGRRYSLYHTKLWNEYTMSAHRILGLKKVPRVWLFAN